MLFSETFVNDDEPYVGVQPNAALPRAALSKLSKYPMGASFGLRALGVEVLSEVSLRFQ